MGRQSSRWLEVFICRTPANHDLPQTVIWTREESTTSSFSYEQRAGETCWPTRTTEPVQKRWRKWQTGDPTAMQRGENCWSLLEKIKRVFSDGQACLVSCLQISGMCASSNVRAGILSVWDSGLFQGAALWSLLCVWNDIQAFSGGNRGTDYHCGWIIALMQGGGCAVELGEGALCVCTPIKDTGRFQ